MPLRLFTSESVTPGHPDKICDQVSDSILDALLAQDPQAHVAVETLVTTGLVFALSAAAAVFFFVADQVIGIGVRALFGVGQ